MNRQDKQDRQRARFILILMTVWMLAVVWLMLIPRISEGGDPIAISWPIYTQECGCVSTYGQDRPLLQGLGYIEEPYTMAHDI